MQFLSLFRHFFNTFFKIPNFFFFKNNKFVLLKFKIKGIDVEIITYLPYIKMCVIQCSIINYIAALHENEYCKSYFFSRFLKKGVRIRTLLKVCGTN